MSCHVDKGAVKHTAKIQTKIEPATVPRDPASQALVCTFINTVLYVCSLTHRCNVTFFLLVTFFTFFNFFILSTFYIFKNVGKIGV